MKEVNWNTQKAIYAFEESLLSLEKWFKDEDYYNDYDDLWEKYDELKQAFEDEFGVRL